MGYANDFEGGKENVIIRQAIAKFYDGTLVSDVDIRKRQNGQIKFMLVKNFI